MGLGRTASVGVPRRQFALFLSWLCALFASLAFAAPAYAQQDCTITAADLPSLQVTAGSTNNTVLSSLTDATFRAAVQAKCNVNPLFIRIRDVPNNTSALAGQTFTFSSGSTWTFNGGSPNAFVYTPGPGVVGTENISPFNDGGRFIRLEASTSVAYTTVYVITLQVSISSAVPTVTGLSPNVGSTAGGNSVTITGTNFTGATGVSFGGTAATGVTVNSATSITATAPARAAGTINVTVTTPGGTSATSAASQYTYLTAPTLTAAFSPTSIVVGDTSTLTFTLTNPNSGTGLSGLAFSSPALPSGLSYVVGSANGNCQNATVIISGGAVTFSGGSLNANASCTTTLQIRGTSAGTYSFTTGAPSATGPTSLTGTAATTNTLTVATPTLGVTFSNSGTNYQGLTASYTLTPSTTTATATSGTINAAITLPSGLSFASATGTGWTCTGVAACSYSSAIAGNSSGNPLTLVLNVAGNATGTLSPSVQLSGGGASNTPSATASTAITAPSISNVSPSSVSTAGGTTVTLTGAGFSASGNTLTIGGSAVTIATQSTTQITFASPAGQSNGATPQIVVTNSGGGQASSTGLTFVSPPTLGLQITHTGNFTQRDVGNFTVTASVTSGGATSGTLTFSTTLPAGFSSRGVTGTGWGCAEGPTITCTTTNSIASGASANPITLLVNVAATSPTSVTLNGTLSGGGASSATTASDTATIIQVPATIQLTEGNNQNAAINTAFGAPLRVTVLDAANAAIDNASVTFTAPAAGASAVFTNGTNTLTVATNASGVASAGTVNANGVAGNYSVTAASGGVSSNFSLGNGQGSQTINFTSTAPGAAVVGGATYTPAATATSGLTVAFTIDAASAGVCAISGGVVSFTGAGTCRVNANQAGNANYAAASQVQQSFAVSPPAPVVATVTPSSGTTAGGTVVALEGANFSGATGVSFGGTPAANFIVNSAASITATAPPPRRRDDQHHGHHSGRHERDRGREPIHLCDARAHRGERLPHVGHHRGRHRRHPDRHQLHRRDGGALRRDGGDELHGQQRHLDHRDRAGGRAGDGGRHRDDAGRHQRHGRRRPLHLFHADAYPRADHAHQPRLWHAL